MVSFYAHKYVLSVDWSVLPLSVIWLVNFSADFLQSTIHALPADWSALLLVHFSANLAQSPMHEIYNVSSDWSTLFLKAIWLVHYSADQNMQYMIWLVSFALFPVLTVWSALLLELSAWSDLRFAYLLCVCQVCRESLYLSLGLKQIGLQIHPQLCQQKIDNYL